MWSSKYSVVWSVISVQCRPVLMGLYPGTLVGCTHLYRSVVYNGRPVFKGKVFSLVKES